MNDFVVAQAEEASPHDLLIYVMQVPLRVSVEQKQQHVVVQVGSTLRYQFHTRMRRHRNAWWRATSILTTPFRHKSQICSTLPTLAIQKVLVFVVQSCAKHRNGIEEYIRDGIGVRLPSWCTESLLLASQPVVQKVDLSISELRLVSTWELAELHSLFAKQDEWPAQVFFSCWWSHLIREYALASVVLSTKHHPLLPSETCRDPSFVNTHETTTSDVFVIMISKSCVCHEFQTCLQWVGRILQTCITKLLLEDIFAE